MGLLLSGATATGAGSSVAMQEGFRAFQAYGSMSASTGAATINIEVSNNPTTAGWIIAASISLSLSTTSATDGVSIISGWKYARANVTAITENGTVSVEIS